MPESAERERSLHPWLLVGLLWVVATLNYLDRQVAFSLFPLLEKGLGATSTQLGLVGSVFMWTYGVLSPAAGYLADRFGRVRIILISLAVWSAVTWLTGHARNMEELLWTRALMGISEACYLPAALALVVAAHPDRTRSLAAGIHQSGLYSGIILGGTWGGWMGEHQGWRAPFLVLGGVGLVYFLVLFALFRRHKEPAATGVPAPLHGLGALMRNPAFVRLWLAFGLMGIANWLVYTWLPAFLNESYGLGLASAGFSATFYLQAASYAGILAGGFTSDRWQQASPRGRILIQVTGLAVAAPFLFLMGTTHSFPILVAGLILFGLGRGLYDCNTMPVLSQFVPAGLCSTGYGMMNMASCVLGGIMAVLAGYFRSRFGLGAAFQASAVVLVAAVILLAGLKVRDHKMASS